MSTKSGSSSRQEPQRVGNYYVENEIGRGSFATVYKGYRSKTHQPCAIKAVSRQKLTAKLLENLEGEISILKAITHPNIVRLEDCFKNDTHIYLVMEYCTGSDLSIYIKNRGKVATLDFEPRPSMFVDWAPKSENEGKVYWPHPTSGGIDERVTRNFLGQLAKALMFLRSQNLMHRDIKPQNLLLHPASATEVSNGQPLGIPILKVADFGFARILPAAAMAETLCGSPLYMAPEILRYEKYDAKADLWSVGAVLFEMAVGKSPFRANNHVELLKRIEKNQDRIKFPDETPPAEGASDKPLPIPVGEDIKALIRGLLKRRPADRMGFEDFFASYKVWEPPQLESSEESLSPDVVSTDSSDILASKVQELVQSIAKEKGKQADRERSMVGLQAPQPLAVDPALNPAPAPAPAIKARPLPPFAVQPSTTTKPAPAPSIPPSPVTRTPRSEPKYYVGNEAPQVAPAQPTATPPAPPLRSPTGLGISTKPRPIVTERRHSKQEPASLEEPGPITPSSAPQVPLSRPRVSEGSPLAATPPMTMTHAASTGKDDSALDAGDSVVGREYVVVEKQTVEVNALADELDRATRANTALVRRPSSRTSVVSRPVSAFKPPLQHAQSDRVKPLSYSPPFGMSTTPPFAIAPTGARHNSSSSTRASPHSGQVNIFPPQALAGRSPESALQTYSRIGTSPSSLQTGALARALTNTAIRMIGQGVNTAATALGRGTSGLSSQRTRRPDIPRTGMLNDAEEGLLRSVEDLASKAFALFELGYERLEHWHALQRRDPALGLGARTPPTANVSQMPNPYAPGSSARRKSSSSSLSANSDLLFLRQQEAAAGEAVVLYLKALTFIVKAIYNIQAHRTEHGGDDTSPEINEMVQWLRARFNECYEKAEWAKQRCAEELPFIDRLLHDKAKEISRQSAHAELSGDTASAEMGYENAIWLLSALLDDAMYEGTGARLRDEDRVSVEKIINPIRTRLETIRRKSTPPTA